MSDTISNGGPAFPCGDFSRVQPFDGMTLRDWFAGQAMAALGGRVISEVLKTAVDEDSSPQELAAVFTTLPKQISDIAYALADTMLTVRSQANDKRE